MTGRDDKGRSSDLPEPVEALLRSWPLEERPREAWEDFALRVEAKVASTLIGATDASVLCAPLPMQPDERAHLFAELRALPTEAVLAAENGSKPEPEAVAAPRERSDGPSGSDDPGFENAAAQSFPDEVFPGDARTPPVPNPGAGVLMPRAFPNLTPWFGGALLGIAATAAFFVMFRPLAPSQPAFVVVPAQSTAQKDAQGVDEATTRAVKVEPTIIPATSLETEEALELKAGGKAWAMDSASARRGAPGNGARAGGGSAENDLPLNATADAVILEDEPAGKDGSAQAGRVASKAPPVTGLEPAAGTGTGLPDRPSLGAAQAAIGSVLTGARSCIAGQEPSRATVVFRSDGTVERVLVTGPAVGTAAEGCIQATLSGARVEAFARPTFSVGTTIRPH